jgi:hippurate hydrolase
VAELLKSFGLEVHTGLAGTGVVAVLKGNMGAGPPSACAPIWMR